MDFSSLQNIIRTHPVIDNHVHNILGLEKACDYQNYPFEQIISEAHDDALNNATATLPLHRATRQLAELYKLPAGSSWNDVKAARDEWVKRDYKELIRACLVGTHCLLLDDLLTDKDVEPYDWHDQFTPARSRRIVRIEVLAEQVLASLQPVGSWESPQRRQNLWQSFQTGFESRLQQAIQDPAVVGFKSVICYRTGLDVQPDDEDVEVLVNAMREIYQEAESTRLRLQRKPLNDWVVRATLDMLKAAKRPASAANVVPNKPLQLHTGLGDNDIDLVKANPAWLQALIRNYPEVDFVLLHSAYPYTRQAGYLASVYPNVYLDLGEVYPMVSRDAQEQILRESFDLVPTSRLLWSTDGHFFPETLYLANLQFREALDLVTVEYVRKGDWTDSQARRAVADILFHNSNRLYDLNETVTTAVPTGDYPSASLSRFTHDNPDIKHIHMQFYDYTGTLRVRAFPLVEFFKLARQERRQGICDCLQLMIQNDHIAPEGSTTGQFYLVGDLNTLHRNVSIPGSKSASLMTFWRKEEDASASLPGCPRSLLQNITSQIKDKYKLDVTCGFEVEVVFLRPIIDQDDNTIVHGYTPCVRNHSWSQMTCQTRWMLPLLEKVVDTLMDNGIAVQQYHAESAQGQFEFVLPPDSPLAAVDTLLRARQIITNVAEQHNLRATLHPRPLPGQAGTAAHAHISITSTDSAEAPRAPPPTDLEESFLAGLMEHYPAVMAFTLSQDASYDRVQSGLWAGSEWVTWGTQNREAPVRRISTAHWEIKSMDGLANMYLAMSACLAAGLIGLNKKLKLRVKECLHDAAKLSTKERQDLGITKKLPRSLEESLNKLKGDADLHKILGVKLVNNYMCVKREERAMLNEMSESTRRRWLIERY
ncbi:glutamine synthetase/guanido kinase [Aspergillus ambiguus]|uniref:extracellular developmental signal biosynthesis protein FluG n=1 Tax=Aspergillus ambiguus TaxID=176160 RepID=UPI003CCD910F